VQHQPTLKTIAFRISLNSSDLGRSSHGDAAQYPMSSSDAALGKRSGARTRREVCRRQARFPARLIRRLCPRQSRREWAAVAERPRVETVGARSRFATSSGRGPSEASHRPAETASQVIALPLWIDGSQSWRERSSFSLFACQASWLGCGSVWGKRERSRHPERSEAQSKEPAERA
jgi:hypothetical protein